MKITIDAASLAKALDTMQKLAPPTNGVVNVSSDGKRLTMHSASETSQCSLKVPAESVSGPAANFAIPLTGLRDATKGHQSLSLSLANASLTIKAKGYQATLATVDSVPIDVTEPAETKTWEVGAVVSDWLSSAVKAVALKPTTLLSTWIPLGIKIGKRAFVACYDGQRVSWVSSQEVSGSFECVAPADTMGTLLEVFKGQALKIQTGAGYLKVVTKLASVTVVTPIDEDIPQLSAVMAKVSEASKADGDMRVVGKASLTQFFENARSVVTKERAEIIATGTMKVKSDIGEVQSKINAGTFKVDYDFFVEAVGKVSGGEVNLKIVEGAFLSIGTEAGSVIVAQNQ